MVGHLRPRRAFLPLLRASGAASAPVCQHHIASRHLDRAIGSLQAWGTQELATRLDDKIFHAGIHTNTHEASPHGATSNLTLDLPHRPRERSIATFAHIGLPRAGLDLDWPHRGGSLFWYLSVFNDSLACHHLGKDIAACICLTRSNLIYVILLIN